MRACTFQNQCRGRAARRINALAQHVKRLRITLTAVGRVQHFSKRRHVVKQLVRHRAERLLGVVHQQVQLRVAAPVDDAALVLVVLALLAAGDGRAVAEQAHQQKRIGQQALLWGDANVHQGVEVKQAHFHILDAVFLQGDGGPLAVLADALGADAGVKLVFDLQHVGVELLPVRALAGSLFDAQRLVERVGCVDGCIQRLRVLRQRVEIDMQIGLHAVLVAQITHAQAGGVRAVQGVWPERLQISLAPMQERGADGG